MLDGPLARAGGADAGIVGPVAEAALIQRELNLVKLWNLSHARNIAARD
jgi:hypothetical protein